jgi:hypothetical protein
VSFFDAAADLATPASEVFILTDGVNSDEIAELNRSLADGEGALLAMAFRPRPLDVERVVMVGIGQVAHSVPPPSQRWIDELRAFNQALCEATGAAECTVRAVADVASLLG